MAGGDALAVGATAGVGEITFTVVMSCLTAASSGLILGYDISITETYVENETLHTSVLMPKISAGET